VQIGLHIEKCVSDY